VKEKKTRSPGKRITCFGTSKVSTDKRKTERVNTKTPIQNSSRFERKSRRRRLVRKVRGGGVPGKGWYIKNRSEHMGRGKKCVKPGGKSVHDVTPTGSTWGIGKVATTYRGTGKKCYPFFPEIHITARQKQTPEGNLNQG